MYGKKVYRWYLKWESETLISSSAFIINKDIFFSPYWKINPAIFYLFIFFLRITIENFIPTVYCIPFKKTACCYLIIIGKSHYQ